MLPLSCFSGVYLVGQGYRWNGIVHTVFASPACSGPAGTVAPSSSGEASCIPQPLCEQALSSGMPHLTLKLKELSGIVACLDPLALLPCGV